MITTNHDEENVQSLLKEAASAFRPAEGVKESTRRELLESIEATTPAPGSGGRVREHSPWFTVLQDRHNLSSTDRITNLVPSKFGRLGPVRNLPRQPTRSVEAQRSRLTPP